MTILSVPAISADGLTTSGRGDAAIGGDGFWMRAWCRHPATVVTISGDVDAVTSDRVQTFGTPFTRVGNGFILDLSCVDFFSARGISVLIAVDDDYHSAEVPWVLVPSPIVSRVLRLTECDTVMPTASAVPAALRQVAALTQARRRFALAATTATRHAV